MNSNSLIRLPTPEPVSIEQDCACASSRIEIFSEQVAEISENDCSCSSFSDTALVLKPNTSSLLEDDCACTFSTVLNHESTVSTAWKMAPHLYRLPLPGKHEVAFNPFGRSSMAVLNESASRFLDIFSNPAHSWELSSCFPDLAPAEIDSAINRLSHTSLIVPAKENKTTPRSIPKTLTAWLHITNACNLRCDYCYVHKSSHKMGHERGIQAIDAIFRSASLNGFEKIKIKYAGGESTLEFGLILELHDYAQILAYQHGMELTGVILSNGVCITNPMIIAMQTHGLRLALSLDGVGANHDSLRRFASGRGSFELVERSLDRLAALGVRPSVTITVSQRNLQGLPKTVEYVLKRGLPFTINFYRENDCSGIFSDLSYGDEQIISALKDSFAVIEQNLPPFSLLGLLTDRARLDAPHTQPCGVENSYLVINQDGRIAKCHMEIENSVTDITSTNPFKDILLSNTGLRNLPVDEKEDCRDCIWRYWCAGGCPALTYRMTGRYDVKSPNCSIYQALFPEVLRLEGLRLLHYAEQKGPKFLPV